MTEVHFHQPVFHVPPRRRAAGVFRSREQGALIDLEFSNYGRSPRFKPGWYILPAVVTGLAIIAAVLLIV